MTRKRALPHPWDLFWVYVFCHAQYLAVHGFTEDEHPYPKPEDYFKCGDYRQ